ncbi:MAG: glycosyltransferase [Hyphomicrobiales bacterium]|nr:glycosyltransferase [Hyphomicrobiales bacterium]
MLNTSTRIEVRCGGKPSPLDLPAGIEPSIHDVESRIDPAREIRISKAGIAFTLAMSVMTVWVEGGLISDLARRGVWSGVIEQGVFLAVVLGLIYGNLVFQACRLVHYRRHAHHVPATREALGDLYARQSIPSLTVLVPCYKEETGVVFQTLMSAALMEFPGKRIALLVDDPPNPDSIADLAALTEMRALPNRVSDLLRPMRNLTQEARQAFARRTAAGPVDPQPELQNLLALHDHACQWLRAQVDATPTEVHADRTFVRETYAAAYDSLCGTADTLRARQAEGSAADTAALRRHYDRLVGLFDAQLTTFERKGFVNLSHLPNKAMNLNSYIGLMGGSFRREQRGGEQHLVRCPPGDADLVVPDSDYIITLDADSLLSHDYAMRLIRVLEQAENRDVAIAQTPYSAFPGSGNLLERMAGATTDVQHIVHQGFTGYNGTYWVGANALIRRRALDDIVETQEERGHPVYRYIQDRTVIEDTESSVDLALRGWRLLNYPDRLAYSATPPDFGSLLIQRRRWSNGGLIILPKLLRYLWREVPRKGLLAEAAVRIHYLLSPTLANAGVLILLLYSFELSLRNYWLPLTALPYFALYGRDMVLLGYKWWDLLRVYALNLLLIPVNLGGVVKSLQQAVTGRQTPFGRTPKVVHRTATPALYILAVWGIAAYCIANAGIDFMDGHWAHGSFAAVNASFMVYALARYVGVANSLEDVRASLPRRPWRRRSAAPADQRT